MLFKKALQLKATNNFTKSFPEGFGMTASLVPFIFSTSQIRRRKMRRARRVLRQSNFSAGSAVIDDKPRDAGNCRQAQRKRENEFAGHSFSSWGAARYFGN